MIFVYLEMGVSDSSVSLRIMTWEWLILIDFYWIDDLCAIFCCLLFLRSTNLLYYSAYLWRPFETWELHSYISLKNFSYLWVMISWVVSSGTYIESADLSYLNWHTEEMKHLNPTLNNRTTWALVE